MSLKRDYDDDGNANNKIVTQSPGELDESIYDVASIFRTRFQKCCTVFAGDSLAHFTTHAFAAFIYQLLT